MRHLKTFFCALMLLGAVSCDKNIQSGEGQVSFGVFSNEDVTDVTRSNVSDYTTLPDGKDFIITLTDDKKQLVFSGSIADWDPAANPLKVGNYSVKAEYGSIEEEGFDKPYFTGEATFAVAGGETKAVPIPVTLGNTVVKISCTQAFRNYYKNYSFKLTRSNAEIVSFTKDDTRAAFVDGYQFNLEGTLEAETKTYTFNKEYKSLDAATAYTFLFDVTNTGGAVITITFNNNVETVELGDYELND